jgi:macrolide-specific efflux system membrane fusion protein
VDVRIIYESRANVLTVPSAAVTTSNGVSTVIVVASDGTQTRRQVTVGETSGNLTEIVSGLSEGDVVLVTTFTPGLPNPGNQGNVPTRFPGRGQFPGGGGFPTGFPRGGGQGGFPGGNP